MILLTRNTYISRCRVTVWCIEKSHESERSNTVFSREGGRNGENFTFSVLYEFSPKEKSFVGNTPPVH